MSKLNEIRAQILDCLHHGVVFLGMRCRKCRRTCRRVFELRRLQPWKRHLGSVAKYLRRAYARVSGQRLGDSPETCHLFRCSLKKQRKMICCGLSWRSCMYTENGKACPSILEMAPRQTAIRARELVVSCLFDMNALNFSVYRKWESSNRKQAT
jgi:hypothetical protein